MGPYMRPIPIGSSAAMLFSLVIAFTITPWAATHILKDQKSSTGHDQEGKAPDDLFTRIYHKIMDPLLGHGGWRILFFATITVMLLGVCSMVYLARVS
jgi:multidrug efflux pump subunit AcrB